MTTNRVDQASVQKVLLDYHARIRALEANPPEQNTGGGLNTWVDWKDQFEFGFISDAGTPPGASPIWAYMMVQTGDGNSWFPADDPSASNPLIAGTVLAGARVTFDSAGGPVTDEPTALLVPTGLDAISPRVDGSFHPAFGGAGPGERSKIIIGSGTICQETVTAGPRFTFKVAIDGTCYVDNTPDPFVPFTFQDFSYRIRVTNVAAGDPGYPFPILAGDTIEYRLVYPIASSE